MVGRGLVSLLGAAIVLGIGAPVALSDEERMVMVTGSPAAIEALEGKGYDVGFVGELTEAGVFVDDASEAQLRAEGYKIGATVEDANTRLAVKAQIAETTEGEALAAEVATNGLTKSAKSKGAVSVPGNIVIQRAYTFTNYAGRFLYVEKKQKKQAPASLVDPSRPVDWQRILYHGDRRLSRDLRGAKDRRRRIGIR